MSEPIEITKENMQERFDELREVLEKDTFAHVEVVVPKKTITEEAKLLYNMIYMMECAKSIYIYFAKTLKSKDPETNGVVKEAGKVFLLYNAFKAKIVQPVKKKSDRAAWKSEWIERDYEVYASVFNLMSEMSDPQRLEVEQFAEQVLKQQSNGTTEN
jgi:hypothetical protein